MAEPRGAFWLLVAILTFCYVLLTNLRQQERLISEDFEIPTPRILTLNRRWWSAALTGPYLDLTMFDKDGKTIKRESAKEQFEVTTSWQNYLRTTSWREMAGWILISMLIGDLLSVATFHAYGAPSFPHRGELVLWINTGLLTCYVGVLWVVTLWVAYETRACVQFINALSDVPNKWPEQLLFRKAKETGIPPAHLDDFPGFQLIVHATQRIQWLIYLPFVSIFFLVVTRSNFFDTIDIPLALALVIGLAYSLYNVRLLRQRAEKVRATALKTYEKLRLSQPGLQIGTEEIKQLMSRINDTHDGAFAPFTQQPTLKALLLPFGGYGGVQIIEYLVKLFGAS